MIGFRNVDMAELRIHTPAERVAIAEGWLLRYFFSSVRLLNSRTSHSSPVFFSLSATRIVYDTVLTWIFRVLILLSPLSGFQPPSSFEFRDPPQRREARFAKRRCALHPGGLLPGCTEHRPRRDRGGSTVPVAASPGFCVRDGSPPGRRQLRWLRSRQPAPPGGRPGKAQAEEEQRQTGIRAAVIRIRTGGKRE